MSTPESKSPQDSHYPSDADKAHHSENTSGQESPHSPQNFSHNPPSPPPGYPNGYAAQPVYYGSHPPVYAVQPPIFVAPPVRPTSAYAVTGFIFSLLWLFWVGSIIGTILSIIGLQETKRGEKSGNGLAIAGIVIGSLANTFWAIPLLFGFFAVLLGTLSIFSTPIFIVASGFSIWYGIRFLKEGNTKAGITLLLVSSILVILGLFGIVSIVSNADFS